MIPPRQRLSWDQLWMRMAELVALRSPDPIVQVGSVLVSSNNKIINTGYNGLISGMLESDIDWGDREQVRARVLHSECNCIVYASSKFEGAKLYVTMSPCKECLKVIAAAGIKTVIHKECFRDYEEVSRLAKEFGLTLEQFKE